MGLLVFLVRRARPAGHVVVILAYVRRVTRVRFDLRSLKTERSLSMSLRLFLISSPCLQVSISMMVQWLGLDVMGEGGVGVGVRVELDVVRGRRLRVRRVGVVRVGLVFRPSKTSISTVMVGPRNTM